MAALDQYFTPYELEFSKETEAERKQLLINTDILAISGETTVGGLLVFGVNPSRYLPQASIMSLILTALNLQMSFSTGRK